MYKIKTIDKQEVHTQANKSVLNFTGLKGVNRVRRPSTRRSSSKNNVLSNTKNHSEVVEVSPWTTKNTKVTSQINVDKNKDCVAHVVVKNALKAKIVVLCVSCKKNVLSSCHDKFIAKYKLFVTHNVRRALFTTPRTAKTKSVDTTPIVATTRFVVVTPLSAKNKVSSASRTTSLLVPEKTLSNCMRTKSKTSRKWPKWFEKQPSFGWPLKSETARTRPCVIKGSDNIVSSSNTPVPVIKWVAKPSTLTYVFSSCDEVIVDDYSRYTWVYVLRTKDEASDMIMKFIGQAELNFKRRKPNVQYFHVFRFLCYLTNDREDLGKLKSKADIGIFIRYSKSLRGFRIYNFRTRKIMETIHVKFDELIAMAFEHSCLEPETNRFNVEESSAKPNQTSSKANLDNLFGPIYEEYFKKISPKNKPSISTVVAYEVIQEDSADLNGNTLITPFNSPMFEEVESFSMAQDLSHMHEFNHVYPSTHTWKKSHLLAQVIGDPSEPVMTRSRLNIDTEVCMYALTEGLHYSLIHLTAIIPYLRFTRIIVDYITTKNPDVPKRLHEHYHRVANDHIVKSIFNSEKNKEHVGIRIPEWMLMKEMKLTKYYQLLPYPVEQQGVLSAPHKPIIIRIRRRSQSDYETPILTSTEIDITIEENLVNEEIEKIVEGNDDVDKNQFVDGILNNQENLNNRLEPGSDKERPEVMKSVDLMIINEEESTRDALIRRKCKELLLFALMIMKTIIIMMLAMRGSNAKRQKTSKHGMFTTDGQGTNDDKVPDEEVSQELLDEVARKVINFNKLQRMQDAMDDMLRSRCDSGEEHQYHLDQI
uniref:Retroviral polymerase SH3-like domain-containing protein n=1 Tax=Tanacetum cinerariifolium TaxID=118510 RepID=A0A6L2KI51_TANCI|nr:hypothetical protein [Tanacetum cinerariifolium]